MEKDNNDQYQVNPGPTSNQRIMYCVYPTKGKTQLCLEILEGLKHTNEWASSLYNLMFGYSDPQPINRRALECCDRECCICLDEMCDNEKLVWCNEGCGQNFHLKCLEKIAQYKSSPTVSCPFCTKEIKLQDYL